MKAAFWIALKGQVSGCIVGDDPLCLDVILVLWKEDVGDDPLLWSG